MLGFGESSQPEIRYDLAVEVAFVWQVVEQLNIEPCCIIGHSFGGWVASAYSLKYPNSVSSLVLASSTGGNSGRQFLRSIRCFAAAVVGNPSRGLGLAVGKTFC